MAIGQIPPGPTTQTNYPQGAAVNPTPPEGPMSREELRRHIHAPTLDTGPHQSRMGRFYIDERFLNEHPVGALAVMSRVVVTECRHVYGSSRFEYMGYSPDFDKVGAYIPEYSIAVKMPVEPESLPVVTFTKIVDEVGALLLSEQPLVETEVDEVLVERERKAIRAKEDAARMQAEILRVKELSLKEAQQRRLASTWVVHNPLDDSGYVDRWPDPISPLAPLPTRVEPITNENMIEEFKKYFGKG